ncbi:unnamed protein product [Symbiodinium necroappetens]|uniref:Uncharacterized protein n=1 Tax=Symbiodinium necroappetens TaxID=1628268 RepID=A0A813A931_9DINO|nr:unnamed protein product [Symbiodinium necroappetens]
MPARQFPFNRRSCLLKGSLLLWIACDIIGLFSQGFAGADVRKCRLREGTAIGCHASRWWSAFRGADCLAARIKDAFEPTMKAGDIPVLHSWTSYEASLPVREGDDGASKLHSRPYFCREHDLDVAVNRLERTGQRRDRVAYLSAPTMRGKSAAILPMFCRSVELGSENSFTHYLYMPFANNDGNSHSPAPNRQLRDLETDELERAGADFMLHCFRRQMNGTYSRSSTWTLPSQLPDLEDTMAKFKEEVHKFLQKNQSNRLLLHIDEHRSMSASAEFKRGAMQLAGSIPARCRVIATYLEPPDLPAQGSSKVCRFAIAMMLVDVGLLMTFDASDDAPATAAGLPRIRLPSGDWNGKARRLLATLRVKLSLFLLGRNIGLDQLHIKQDEKSELCRTFMKVQEALDADTDLERKLIGAITSISVILPQQGKQVSGAVDLLLGVEDSEADDSRYPGVVSLDNRKLTLPLEMLLAARDDKGKSFNLFCDGQSMFRQSILGKSDWCDGLVLERAYAWAIACKAAQAAGRFPLDNVGREFLFQCKELRDGIKQFNGKSARVFTKKGTPSIDGIRCIEDGVIYHALSEGGKAGTHQGFDIWFKTEANELVLVDVTGATNAKSCEEKAGQIAQNAAAAMNEVQVKNVESVIGVLLAPNCDSAIEEPPSAQVVRGDAARDLLGGLQQLLTWLGEDVD